MFSIFILFNNFIKILYAIYDCCIKYFKRRWWLDFVASILVTTFVKKKTRKCFNKTDSSWLFICTRVAVKLGTTKKQINLSQASALSRPLNCVSWPFSHTASVYLLYMNCSTLYRKNAQCRYIYTLTLYFPGVFFVGGSSISSSELSASDSSAVDS